VIQLLQDWLRQAGAPDDYRAGRYDDALRMFQQVVALTPDSYRGYSSIGAVYFMKDQSADAVAAFQKSLAIKPNYAAASNLRDAVLLRRRVPLLR
jgi:tetratricopeptide (TPR) repeat protein